MKHPDSPVTFYERMQAAKAVKRQQAAEPVVPAKRTFTPARKEVVPEHKGVLAVVTDGGKPGPVKP